MSDVRKFKNGWRHRHETVYEWVTAAWHISNQSTIILKLKGKSGYFIFPYDEPGEALGVCYSKYNGPYATLTAAKMRLLLGNIDYRPNSEYVDA